MWMDAREAIGEVIREAGRQDDKKGWHSRDVAGDQDREARVYER